MRGEPPHFGERGRLLVEIREDDNDAAAAQQRGRARERHGHRLGARRVEPGQGAQKEVQVMPAAARRHVGGAPRRSAGDREQTGRVALIDDQRRENGGDGRGQREFGPGTGLRR